MARKATKNVIGRQASETTVILSVAEAGKGYLAPHKERNNPHDTLERIRLSESADSRHSISRH
jgi:hypothetical protein